MTKIIVVILCLLIILIVSTNKQLTKGPSTCQEDFNIIELFPKYSMTIHYYSKYSKTWNIEIETDDGHIILTAKNKDFKAAIKQLDRQVKALAGAR
jgi:hypothetical protein